MQKTSTDLFWNDRPQTQIDPKKVNIDDLAQRDLETAFIAKHLKASDSMLEVGCGNGYFSSFLREKVQHLDSFDYSENMVAQAKEVFGETNNRFFHDNLLQPKNVEKQYDVVLCVRVLINLQSLEQQQLAMKSLLSWVKKGGKLIVIEGFIEGFQQLNTLRKAAKISPLSPAAINFYSSKTDFEKCFINDYKAVDKFHTGMFDFLTRIIYPALVGAEKATGMSDFHEKILPVVEAYNPDEMNQFARLHGWVLERK